MKKVLILFGPPGAGKGTQAELLSDKLDLFYFETSKILEERFKEEGEERFILIEGKEYDALEEKKLWMEGNLCSPPFVAFLVKEKIKKLYEEGKGLILAGSPRSLYESEQTVPFMKDLYGAENIRTILLDITPEQTMHRNSNRRICSLARHPILYLEETKELKKCPLDGSELVRRKGLDDPETIKVRLEEYKSRTLPALENIKEQGIDVRVVDGGKPPVEVFEDVIKNLEDF